MPPTWSMDRSAFMLIFSLTVWPNASLASETT